MDCLICHVFLDFYLPNVRTILIEVNMFLVMKDTAQELEDS